jgi:antagonist of KipI
MITVLKAPAFATVQDQGREGWRSSGVPPSGAMDRRSLAIGNFLAGNPAGSAGLEWALGGGTIRFESAASLALAGARARATLSGQPVAGDQTLHARGGAILAIEAIERGRFLYICVAGGIAVPPVLQSRSTYLPAALGGLEGRRLVAGDVLPLRTAERRAPAAGFSFPPPSHPESIKLRVVAGPQSDRFGPEVWRQFLGEPFEVTPASDRMGYRLRGPRLAAAAEAGTLPSEAACPGAVQVPDDGAPIVLMPDGPTVGGYPKLGVVIGVDLPRLAQCTPGHAVRFRPVSVDEAEAAYRREVEELELLEQLAVAAGAREG